MPEPMSWYWKHPLRPAVFKNFGIATLTFATAFALGHWFDRNEDERMTKFRDKSALYGRTLAPGEKPSW
ncbi:NADH dehydrogenase [ubiquinone] 1 beta subcomplex subunit 1 [Aphidius gifuensis]|uniref:NADH dehydrogenase [ubiquinone] 1 beta subcomplex subunit 1 n=1 Tax=Aphidius gifuensis TaxID=684658 RepID=UPI001CDB7C07|nr:NADH dehydrogenase [ubiquinone] 1 beta subcomplex subunit 1 [Aphidius gifuensis]